MVSCLELHQNCMHGQMVVFEISPGRSQDVEIGMHFQIYSNSSLMGLLSMTRCLPNMLKYKLKHQCLRKEKERLC